MLDDQSAALFAKDLATALANADVPCIAGPGGKTDWRLSASATLNGNVVIPAYAITGPDGKAYGKINGAPVDAAAWANGDAAALFSMARNVFGGLGISISTALITDHQQINQSHLIANLSPSSAPYQELLQQVQQTLLNSGQSMAQAVHNAPGQVYSMLQTQVAVLAYNDVFLITACGAFILVPAALAMSGVKAKAAGGAH